MIWWIGSCDAQHRDKGANVARRVETELKEATAGDVPDGEVQALIAAAARKREEADAARPPTTRRRKRKASAPAENQDDPAFADAATPGGSALDGIPSGPGGFFARSGLRVWTALGIAAATALVVLSLVAVGDLPAPLPVSNVAITWLPGPRVPDAEVMAWLRRCPQFEKLNSPNEWVLGKLADHLRGLPAVSEVRQVRLFHEPGKMSAVRRVPGKPPVMVQVDGLRRTVEIQLSLRKPYLPAVLGDRSRVWIDEDGIVLPGILPSPGVQRPMVRMLEAGGKDSVQAAVDLWQRLEPQIEKGLVSDIVLNDVLDLPATPTSPRGIVLYTRQGARLVWGHPGEEKFGVGPEEKVRDLVHTLHCQGDLSRIAAVNVRFHEPFYLLRDDVQQRLAR
jgi:hypothetical protein